MRLIRTLSLVLLLTWVFFRFLYPVSSQYDTDILWHLKTGEVIVNEGGIPTTDPFTYSQADPLRARFVLGSYWLADTLFYLIHQGFGFRGLVIFKAAVFSAVTLMLFLQTRHRGFHVSVILAALAGLCFSVGSVLKPNIFSILFATTALISLERYSATGRIKFGVPLVLSMWAWANTHGGYVLGVTVLGVFAFVDVVESIVRSKETRLGGRIGDALRRVIFVIAAMAVTLVNPRFADAFLIVKELFLNPSHSFMTSLIVEHMGFFTIMKEPGFINIITFVTLLASGIILILTWLNITRAKTRFSEAATVLFTLFLAITSVRLIPIFVIAGIVLMAGKERLNLLGSWGGRKSIELAGSIGVAGLMSLMAYTSVHWVDPGIFRENNVIGLRVAKFLEENKLNGNMLNLEYGGNFLLYMLYPQYKVLTDTRYVNFDVYVDANRMMEAVEGKTYGPGNWGNYDGLVEWCVGRIGHGKWQGGEGYWREVMDRYDISYIVGRVTHPATGKLYLLFEKLADDNRWKLVYADGNFVVLVKEDGRNSELLDRYEPIEKNRLYDQMIEESTPIVATTATETLAFAYFMKGDLEKAEKLAQIVVKLSRDHRVAPAIIGEIERRKSAGTATQPRNYGQDGSGKDERDADRG